MGCFFPCFSTPKHKKKLLQSANISPAKDQKHEACEALKPTESIKPISNITDIKGKQEEQLSCQNKKKVTFDVTVTIKEIVSDLVETSVEKSETVEREKTQKANALPSKEAYPPNHRYNNCTNSDDEYVDIEIEEGGSYNEEDGEDHTLVQEESSESLFSLSIDSSRRVSRAEVGEKEVNSPMPIESKTNGSNPNALDRRQYVHSVLMPIENLAQWKAVKAKGTPPVKHQLKENINLDEECKIPLCSEPSIKVLTCKSKPHLNQNLEMAVDTSLSSWLVTSETTPMSKTSSISVGNSGSEKEISWMSHEDKLTLGASAIKGIKQFSATSSPKRSPSWSPDDIPIIGTIGSYWRHTGHTMDSDTGLSCKNLPITTGKNKEDKKVNLQGIPFETRLEMNLQGTPFETRLERALESGIAQA